MIKEMTPEERRRLQKSAPSLFRETDPEKISNFLARTRAIGMSRTGKVEYIAALHQVGATDGYIKEEKVKIAELVGFRTGLATSLKTKS